MKKRFKNIILAIIFISFSLLFSSFKGYNFNSKIQVEEFKYFNIFTKDPDQTCKIMFYADKYNINYAQAFSLIQAESGFQIKSYYINIDGTIDRSLMALNSYFFPMSLKDAYNMDCNLDTGMKFLKKCLTKYNNDFALACIAYNSGDDSISYNIVKEKTFKYLTKILILKINHEKNLNKIIKDII